jgi:HEPN domain-containing protein
MARDDVKVADTRAWLLKAHNDLRGARLDVDADPPLFEDALFHCQQAVEKSLKAYLTWNDRPFRKTHSIEELGEACLESAPDLAALIDRAVPLTEYAWAFRYPGEYESPSREEVEGALSVATEVHGSVVSKLPEETRPEV